MPKRSLSPANNVHQQSQGTAKLRTQSLETVTGSFVCRPQTTNKGTIIYEKNFSILVAFVAVTVLAVATVHGQETGSKWKGSGALGFTVNKGNTDTMLLNLTGDLERVFSAKDSAKAGAGFTYGKQKVDGVKTTNAANAYGFFQYKRLFTERLYGLARVDLFHDDIADVKYRLILSPALGYYFIKNETSSLTGEIGPSYIREKVDNTTDDYVTARLSERFEHAFNKTWRMWQSLDFYPQVNDFENYLLIGEIGTEAALNTNMTLRVVLKDTYDNEPAPGRKKNDFTIITAIGYRF